MAEGGDAPSVNTAVFIIRLLCDKDPELDGAALLSKLRTVDESIRQLSDDGSMIYVNERYGIEFIAGKPAAPIMVCMAENIDQRELEMALEQTWDLPEAASAVKECQHAILICEMQGQFLKSKDRLANLQKVLATVLGIADVKAVHWPTSRRIVNPQTIMEALEQGEYDSIANGAVNVRLYNIEDTENEIVMDTIGMEYLSLTDFQCHFKDLPPSEVAATLFGCAGYLLNESPNIESGHTIEGCDGMPWLCSFEHALIEPGRQVIDLHPGQFAAGKRN